VKLATFAISDLGLGHMAYCHYHSSICTTH